MLGLTTHLNVSEILDWDRVASVGGLYSSVTWLKQCETPTTRYLVVRDDQEAVAVMPCTVATAPGDLPPSTDLYCLFGNRDVPSPELAAQLYPHVSCGTVRGYSNRLLVVEGLDRDRRASVIRKLLEGAREFARAESAKLISFGYLPPSDIAELRAIDDTLLPVFAESEAVLERVTSFDEFLGQMNHKHRNTIQREMHGFTANGMRHERRRLMDVFEPLCELVTIHERKFDPTETVEANRHHFQQYITAGLDPWTHVHCVYQGATLVALCVAITYGSTAYLRVSAAAPDAPKKAYLYFNVVFYEPARTAAGLHEIHYGLKSLEGKVLRGASLRPLWFLLDWLTPIDANLDAQLVAAGERRFATDVELLSRYRDEVTVREQLDLERARALLGDRR